MNKPVSELFLMPYFGSGHWTVLASEQLSGVVFIVQSTPVVA